MRLFRRVTMIATALLGCVAVLLVGAPAASAHASLVESFPLADVIVDSAPKAIELVFSEEVSAEFGGVKVFDPSGKPVDLDVDNTEIDGVTVRPQIEGVTLKYPIVIDQVGTYTVSWRVTSADGHSVSGSYLFHYKEISSTTGAGASSDAENSVTSQVGRWMAFIGLFVLIGASIISVRARDDVVPMRLWVGALGIALVGSLVIMISRVSEVTGKGFFDAISDVGDYISAARPGQLDALRFSLLVLAAGSMSWYRTRTVMTGVWAALALMTFSWNGHAWVAPGQAVAVVVDMGHLLGASTWIGALLVVTLMGRTGLAQISTVARIAPVGLVTTAITGAISSSLHLDRLSNALETDYGQLLAVKLVAVGVVAALGWFNRKWITSSLEKLLIGVRVEVVAAVIVLLMTSSLVSTPPPRDLIAGTFSETVDSSRGRVNMSVSPRRVGNNDVHVNFLDAAGRARSVDASEVTVEGPGVAPRRIPSNNFGLDHLSVSAAMLVPGRWTITVDEVTDGTRVSSAFEVELR